MSWIKPPQLPPQAQLQGMVADWFGSELGQQLLAQQQLQLDPLMPKLFGYHLLQVSVLDDIDLTIKSPAGHRFMLLSQQHTSTVETAFVGTMESLPIASECVDAVVLHHTLDFAQNPHQTLREAVRVLRPGGRLIIVGFNPHSFWGLYRLAHRRLSKRQLLTAPWVAHFMASRRIYDWLSLLEMRPEKIVSGFFRPPWKSSRWMERLQRLESWGAKSGSNNGAYWIIYASKETCSVTPIGRRWRHRFALPVTGVSPSVRSKQQVRRQQKTVEIDPS
ncbi:MAG: class I SAM-dependent methyltransferase [Motiliproteus sp.]